MSENAGLCDVCESMKNNLKSFRHEVLHLDWRYRSCAMCQSYYALPLTDVLIAYAKYQQKLEAGDAVTLRVRWQSITICYEGRYAPFADWLVRHPEVSAERLHNIKLQLAMLDDDDDDEAESNSEENK